MITLLSMSPTFYVSQTASVNLRYLAMISIQTHTDAAREHTRTQRANTHERSARTHTNAAREHTRTQRANTHGRSARVALVCVYYRAFNKSRLVASLSIRLFEMLHYAFLKVIVASEIKKLYTTLRDCIHLRNVCFSRRFFGGLPCCNCYFPATNCDSISSPVFRHSFLTLW